MSPDERFGRTYAGVASDARKQERRGRLIATGLVLYGTNGYIATTINQLCTHAGLHKRYFYESFASADELLAAVYLEAAERVQGHVAAAIAVAGSDLLDQATAGIRAFFTVIGEDRCTATILLSELLPVSDVVRNAIRAATHTWIDLIEGLFVDFDYRGHHNNLVAATVWSMLAGSSIRWALDDYAEPAEQVEAILIDVVADLIDAATRT